MSLRDSTTYRIQLGNTIQDLKRATPPRACGTYSRRGSTSTPSNWGTVADALDGKPLVQALVGLYRSEADSVLTSVAPDYFTRTDSSGQFLLDYLSPGRYLLAAYLDEKSNYRLNEGAEALAFAENLVTVAAGTPDTSYALRASATYAPLRVLRGEQLYPGYLRLMLDRPAAKEMAVEGVPGEVVARIEDGDSLFVAYVPAVDSLDTVRLAYRGIVDTDRLRRTLGPRRRPETPGGLAGDGAVQQSTSSAPRHVRPRQYRGDRR